MISDPTATVVPRSDAQRRCQQIQLLLESMTRQKEKVLFLVTEAKKHDDHLVLGYPSWPAYVSAEFAGALTELTRNDRRWFAFALSETGMSSRAIAPIVGVSDRQVRYDAETGGKPLPTSVTQQQVGQDVPPDRDVRLGEDLEDRLDEDRDLDARLGNALAEIPKITSTTPTNVVVGMDGKSYPTYPRSRTPSRRKRLPLPDAYRDAVYDLRRAVEKLDRLTADDRFVTNRPAIRARNGTDLAGISKMLWKVRGALGAEAGQ